MIVLRYDMLGAYLAGEKRHPQIVYKEYGLQPIYAWGETIAGCWILHCPDENVASVALPSWIKPVDYGVERRVEINEWHAAHPDANWNEMYRALHVPKNG